ncbi:hypothetical protein OHB06_52265 [Streptomyces sp. NBC_01604]|uniref:NACHT domain-containing protein n=1 Tax=Streptomyces sp. NBC_01604 TaxID=2975894 RepID=UPI00386B3E47
MRHTPAVVVLGERGCGKSVALAQERTRLLEAGLPVAFLDLGKDVFDLASAGARLYQHLHASMEMGERFVLLDGLDEGLSDIPGLDKALLRQVQELSEEERRGLRLRITCRTTRWPAVLEEGLCSLWPSAGQVAVATLAPLTRADLQTATEQHGLNPTDFMTEVGSRNLEALTQQPVTLVPLIEAHAHGVALPATVADAYAQACRTLCTETREEDFTRRQGRPPVDHLLAIARWAAAAMQFSRCAALVDGPPAGEGELDLDALAGAGVPGPAPNLECRRRELLYLTESGLLTPVGRRRWVFAHRSFQEYLAAEFLSTSRISPTVLKELLWTGSGRARHIVPAHEEVAARLAIADPQLFEDLLAHDLPVLLLADLHALTARHRAQVTRALLEGAPETDVSRIPWNGLDHVDHPGLAAQLQSYLTPDADPDQQHLALQIAAACRPAGLTPALLTVTEDRAQPVPVRSLALRALDQVDDTTADRLLLLAADPAPRIAEEALARLWPHRLSTTEYLDLLPDPRPQAARSLFEATAPLLIPEQVANLLDWSTHTLAAQGSKSAWAAHLAIQAIANLAQADRPSTPSPLEEQAGQALAALMAHRKLTHRTGIQEAFGELAPALGATPALRRHLAGYLLHHSTPQNILRFTRSTPQHGLFPDTDLLHWLTRWPDLSDQARHTIRSLIGSRPRPDDPQLREAAERVRQTDPALRQATDWWDAPDPPWLIRRRAHERYERRRLTFNENQFTAALEAVCGAGPHTVRQAWSTAVEHLYRTADGTRATAQSTLDAVMAAPSHPPKGSDLYQALVAAAHHALVTAPVVTAHDIPAWRTGYHQIPELGALGFLLTATQDATVPQTDAARWAGWALALAALLDPGEDSALRYTLLQHCADQAGPAFVTAVEDRLHHMPHRLDELTETLASASLHDATDAMYHWASTPGCPSEPQGDVLGVLARRGHLQARAHLADVVSAGPQAGPERRRRWITAVLVLMSCDGLTDIWPTASRYLTDQVLFTELTDQMMNHPAHRRVWPKAVADLSESVLADLYVRLMQRPELQRPRPRREPDILYTATTDDTLHDLADALLRLMVNKETTAAADELDQLSRTTHRDPGHLASLARRTARHAARRTLKPLSAHQLRQMADDRSLRVPTDEAHLLDVVMEALDSVQEALSGPNGLAILLWNRRRHAAGSPMWPMWEEDFSDLVMGLLKIHLSTRRVVINREVQVDRPGAGGGRTDIHIQAATDAEDPEPFTVIIECKGCWNPGLDTALADQLVARYLRRPRTAGVFLVGFFDCDLWDDRHRPRCTPGHTRQLIEQRQHVLAAQSNATVRAKVLDCRPPGMQTN